MSKLAKLTDDSLQSILDYVCVTCHNIRQLDTYVQGLQGIVPADVYYKLVFMLGTFATNACVLCSEHAFDELFTDSTNKVKQQLADKTIKRDFFLQN
jgi:hypothetical protein